MRYFVVMAIVLACCLCSIDRSAPPPHLRAPHHALPPINLAWT
jgi:hypothetical protein